MAAVTMSVETAAPATLSIDPVPDDESETRDPWSGLRLFGGSRRGRGHALAGGWREDAFRLACGGTVVPWWMIAVADGAGSCRLSRVGARLAVDSAARFVADRIAVRAFPPERLLRTAARAALAEIVLEAECREVDDRELACTLLLLLCPDATDPRTVVTFQVGDGLIATMDDAGTLTPLAEPDEGEFAGGTRFVTCTATRTDLAGRTAVHRLPVPPRALLVLTDGIADDLHPRAVNGPILSAALRRVAACPDPRAELLEMLGYRLRGSFDDRTLACAWCAPERGAP
jgi:hypothetical protein